MKSSFFTIIFLLIGFAIGLFLLLRIIKKHKKIDTESIAVVEEIHYLGRDDGRKVYGLKYAVRCSEPYEFWVTPTRKPLTVGKERTIFYEKADPKNNYFFKKIGTYDTRLTMPTFLTVGCFVATIITLCSIIIK